MITAAINFKKGDVFATDEEKLSVAIAEAHLGMAEGGIPIGAALFDEEGRLLGSGHNLRVQEGDASMHGETSAFRNAGRQRSYRKVTLATSLSPCWYCSGSPIWHWPSAGGRRQKLYGWPRLGRRTWRRGARDE
jgi:cytosine deaminase